jgi:hypothetical protein
MAAGAASGRRQSGAVGAGSSASTDLAALALLWLLAGSSSAAAQSKAKPAPDENREIVVVAQQADRASIDRTTYVVRDTPEARSANALDLLGHVPSVEVSPTGQVRLLGTGGVKILVDGKEVADANAMLRSLQGSQVGKIEVISNPSAQFSARGTGGIINIVTRQTLRAGLGGSVTANAENFGTVELRLSPTWSRKRVSLSGSLAVERERRQPSDVDQDRYRVGLDGAQTLESSERSTNRGSAFQASGNASISYKLTDRQTISLAAFAVRGIQHGSAVSALLLPDPPTALTRNSKIRADFELEDVSANYRRDGRRAGETLTGSAKWTRLHVPTEDRFLTSEASGAASAFLLHSGWDRSTASFKLDYARPTRKERRLSLGVALERTREEMRAMESGEAAPGAPPVALSSVAAGSFIEGAAYATYQFPLLGGTVLAGTRVEGRRYSFEGAPGLSGTWQHNLFPSLHLERKLGKRLTGRLSYSRRVNWPEVSALDPALRFSDPRTAYFGNVSLRPELTNALEAKVSLKGARRTLDLTAYSRETKDVVSRLSTLDAAGVLTTHPVNFGTRLLRGASFVLQGSLGRRFSYVLNGNLADERLTRSGVRGAFARAGAQYDGSAKLDYRDGREGRRGADHVAVTARYFGPRYDGFTRTDPYLQADGSWSHAFTDRLSGVLKVADLVRGRYTTSAVSGDSASRTIYRNRGRRITVSLTYSLARPGGG